METLIHAGLLNALFAALLAVIVAGLAILCRGRPAVVHALWVLVLVKAIGDVLVGRLFNLDGRGGHSYRPVPPNSSTCQARSSRSAVSSSTACRATRLISLSLGRIRIGAHRSAALGFDPVATTA